MTKRAGILFLRLFLAGIIVGFIFVLPFNGALARVAAKTKMEVNDADLKALEKDLGGFLTYEVKDGKLDGKEKMYLVDQPNVTENGKITATVNQINPNFMDMEYTDLGTGETTTVIIHKATYTNIEKVLKYSRAARMAEELAAAEDGRTDSFVGTKSQAPSSSPPTTNKPAGNESGEEGGGGGGGSSECLGCEPKDVEGAVKVIEEFHKWGEEDITLHTSQEFNKHRDTFLYQEFFHKNFLPALMKMTKQFSTVAMKQMFAVGTFFDAKNQLETQRMLQGMQAQAHKDYHPSEDFCYFGTNIRSMAHSESLGRFNTLALSQRAMARHLGRSGVAASDADKDKGTRWDQFASTYCDPKDNNWIGDSSGLEQVCYASTLAEKRNLDVDYTRLIEEARTLDVNFTDEKLSQTETASNEQDVIALANNLYGHEVLRRVSYLDDANNQKKYMALRAVAAKRSVAENSFNAIVGMKSSGSSGAQDATSAAQTRRFLGAVLVELGMSEGEINEVLGENPSYYAQLEILAKKIYQNPDFYANLYDKPANLQRKSVAIKAIEMLVDDAIAKSIMRQEMLEAVSLSTRLEPRFDEVNEGLK